MEIFQQQPTLMQNAPEAKKIIKDFNKLAKVLLEFEVLYYRGWLSQVRSATISIIVFFSRALMIIKLRLETILISQASD
jgi:hypothetical protein